MTGIYGGFVMTQLYLLLRRRYRASGVPSLSILVTLSLFIVAMGLDGVNSMLDDLRLMTVYQPSNLLRYVTGALTGTTLAVFLWLLTSNILWHADHQRPDKVIGGVSELALIAVPITAFGLLAMSGWSPVYDVIAVFLVWSAVLVVFELAICMLQLGRKRENSAASLRDLSSAALMALLCAYGFMSLIAGSRFIMEATMNLRPLP